MNLRRAAWKVFSLHRNELYFAVPLFVLYFLSGSFYTLGQIYAETRFLKSYGAGAFSYFFIMNGLLLIAAGLLYSLLLLRIPLRRGYVSLIMLSFFSIAGGALAAETGWSGTHFYIYTINYLFTFFLDIHFFNFAFIHLNLSNSRRVLPFLMAGGKLGGILASLIIFWGERSILLEHGTLFWGANALLLILPIGFLRSARIHSAAGTRHSVAPAVGLLKQIEKKTSLNMAAPLFKVTALSVFIMAALNQASEYYFASAFNNTFTSEAELAGFLSVYTFSADIITLIVQFVFVSRIIAALGVQRSNYIYPGAFIAFLLFFMTAPGLAAGIMIRFFRKNLSVIIRTPVFNIILSALPRSGMAEAKSVLSGIIAPGGMVAGGALIYLIDSLTIPAGGYAICLILAAAVLYLTLLQNRSYISSISRNLSAGIRSCYEPVPQTEDFSSMLTSAVQAGFDQKAIEDLFTENPSSDAIEYFYERYETLSLDTRRALLDLISCLDHPMKQDLLMKSASDPYIEIRAMTAETAASMTLESRIRISESHPGYGSSSNENFAFHSLRLPSPPVPDRVDLERLKMMKNLVVRGKLNGYELLLRGRIHRPETIADIIYETAMESGSPLFLREIARHAGMYSRDRIRRLIFRFRDNGGPDLDALLERSPLASTLERVLILDLVKGISEERMLRLFPSGPDEKTGTLISERLKKDLNLFRKENYLNYFMTFGIRNTPLIRGFIEAELAAITMARSIAVALSEIQETAIDEKSRSLIIPFLIEGLYEVIESRKRLILKGVALETGVHLDRVYESNLLVNDKDLNACLFEYINTNSLSADRISGLFNNRLGTGPGRVPGISLNTLHIIDEALRAVKFIPELAELTRPLQATGSGPEGSPSLFNLKSGGNIMLDIMQKILYLKKTGIFRDLKPGELIHIARITEEIEIPRGRFIIRQGESGDELFIIISGEVEISKENHRSEIIGPGNSIGELSIIDAEMRSTNVITRQKTRFLCLKRKDFLLTLKQNPAISINVMKIITERLRYFTGRQN